MSKYQETTDHQHHDNNGQEPQFLAGAKERPEFDEKVHGEILDSELVRKAGASRTRRVTPDPVAVEFRVEAAAQRVTASEAHYRCDRCQEPEVHHAHHYWADYTVEQDSQTHPRYVQGV